MLIRFLFSDLTFSTSARGAHILQLRGYRFSRHCQLRYNKTRWFCATHHNRGCRAYIITTEDFQVFKCFNQHTHDPPIKNWKSYLCHKLLLQKHDKSITKLTGRDSIVGLTRLIIFIFLLSWLFICR